MTPCDWLFSCGKSEAPERMAVQRQSPGHLIQLNRGVPASLLYSNQR
jgi:hypothetical protein